MLGDVNGSRSTIPTMAAGIITIINALNKSSLSFHVRNRQSIPRSPREVVGSERQVYTHDFLIYFSTELITAAACGLSVIFCTTALGCNHLFLPGFCCIACFHLVSRYKEGGLGLQQINTLNHCVAVKSTHTLLRAGSLLPQVKKMCLHSL